MGKLKRKPSLLLKRNRAITSNNSSKEIHATSLKPQRTRQLIRRFHILQKQKSSIFRILETLWGEPVTDGNYQDLISKKKNISNQYNKSREHTFKNIKLKNPSQINFNETDSDKSLVEVLGQIDAEIEKRGGLQTYQTASTLGQTRGGDSSKKLMEWLQNKYTTVESKPNALEIGCLSSQNLISTSNFFSEVTRIDLRSQEPTAILEQDFMKRPLPKTEQQKFGLISCSLVVNFVPTASKRGEMLKRITRFLKTPNQNQSFKPMLFLVLPLPCVSNSRYLDNQRLDEIMSSLGFTKLEYYEAKKVAYWLWQWSGDIIKRKFEKKELHKGGNRNNFCIVIE